MNAYQGTEHTLDRVCLYGPSSNMQNALRMGSCRSVWGRPQSVATWCIMVKTLKQEIHLGVYLTEHVYLGVYFEIYTCDVF